jgi:hypothetical protein
VRSLSASETVEAARALLSDETLVSQSDLSALLTVAIKLYASLSSDPYGDEALAGLGATTTEACTVATALLRAQALTPFEFAIWFSSSGR